MKHALLLLLVMAPVYGQSSSWQGEWGGYREARDSKGILRAQGQRLSVTSCLNDVCQAAITTSTTEASCHGSGSLLVNNNGLATLKLQSGEGPHPRVCTLSLSLQGGSARSIGVAAKQDKACSALCTRDCSFERSFAFSSRTPFYGDDIPGCFLHRSTSQMAVCQDHDLADKQSIWLVSAREDASLLGRPFDRNDYRDKAYSKCNNAEQPSACLNALFNSESEAFTRHRSAWLAGIKAPGDAEEAHRKATAIAGYYQHQSHQTGGSGDTKRPGDQLAIRQAGPGAVTFKLDLGRRCSIDGQATYRSNGAFVFESAESGEPCLLVIVASNTGVELQKPIGSCRTYCGESGSFDTIKFSYSERTQTGLR